MADTESPVIPVTFKKRTAKSTARKRIATPPPQSDSDSGFESSEDEQGRPTKRRKNNTGVVASSTSVAISRATEVLEQKAPQLATSNADNATKTSNWYDEDPSQSAVKKPGSKSNEIAMPDGTYKGASNYTSFIQKNPDKLSSKTIGPQKTSSNVRTITVTDFAPDVCKDYKQTGFCGFGDSCKFLHAREDYAQGWQLDRDWEINTKGKKLAGRTVASANRDAQNKGEEDENDDAALAKIPFACIICKKSYTNPIITKCGHYFCEACAIKRYRKDPSCAACGSGTGGVFNVAKKLNKLLERKRERAKERREAAEANGEEIPGKEEVLGPLPTIAQQ